MPVTTVFPAEHVYHTAPHEFIEGKLVAPAHEAPDRAEIIRAALETARLGPIVAPRSFLDAHITDVHAPDYVAYLETAYERWVALGGSPVAVLPDTLAVRWMGTRRPENPLALPGYYAYDISAPITEGTYRAARAAANAALTAAALLLEGEQVVYALCRPPGHHAGRDLCGGYCFLNNAAIAAQYLVTQQRGPVALLDIDYHHGNGTQQIFYERADVLFVSLHADPAAAYPYFLGYEEERGAGAGMGATRNIPLPPGTDDDAFLAALEHACQAIEESGARTLVLSAGFDTFGGDPVAMLGDAGFALTTGGYTRIGARLAQLGLPTVVVQEGGYATAALGDNVVALLQGLA